MEEFWREAVQSTEGGTILGLGEATLELRGECKQPWQLLGLCGWGFITVSHCRMPAPKAGRHF